MPPPTLVRAHKACAQFQNSHQSLLLATRYWSIRRHASLREKKEGKKTKTNKQAKKIKIKWEFKHKSQVGKPALPHTHRWLLERKWSHLVWPDSFFFLVLKKKKIPPATNRLPVRAETGSNLSDHCFSALPGCIWSGGELEALNVLWGHRAVRPFGE